MCSLDARNEGMTPHHTGREEYEKDFTLAHRAREDGAPSGKGQVLASLGRVGEIGAQWEGIPNAVPTNSVKRESLFVKRKTGLFIAFTING